MPVTDFIELEVQLDSLEFIVMIEFIDAMWWTNGDDVQWNTADSREDLFNGDGDTYSCEIRGGSKRKDGRFIVNGDNGCGEMITYIFNEKQEVQEQYA